MLVGPGYDGPDPQEGYVYRSRTRNVFIFWRAFFRDPTDLSEPVATIKRTVIHPLGQPADPAAMRFPHASGVPCDMLFPGDGSYFELLDRFIQNEAVDPADLDLRGFLHSIGIERGKPFDPTPHERELLDAAGRTAYKVSKVTVGTLLPLEPGGTYYEGHSWINTFAGESCEFQASGSFTNLEQRTGFFTAAYTLRLPPGVPARLFWSGEPRAVTLAARPRRSRAGGLTAPRTGRPHARRRQRDREIIKTMPPASATPTRIVARRAGHRRGEELIRELHATGDQRLREQVVAEYLPLARKLARRFHRGAEPLEDLVQVACVGLLKAVDRFDPASGYAFSSFAIPTITGELRRHFRDTTWALHVPRGMQEAAQRVKTITAELSNRHGRAPSVAEIAKETGLDLEEVLEAMQARTAQDTLSLDQPAGTDDDATTLIDILGGEDEMLDLVEDRATLAAHLRALPEYERKILYMRFGQEMTQTQIGEQMGCSQMQISRILRRTIDALATAVAEEPARSIPPTTEGAAR